MKKTFLAFLWIVTSLSLPVLGNPQKKTVCLNMIVKDEKPVICRCLESVKPFIDYWIIVDTGSTDGTQQTIKDFMKDIPGELHERPWVNFAHNRNEALTLAKAKADYLLLIDADEQLLYDKTFKLPQLDKDSYYATLLVENSSCHRKLLIKSSLPWSWQGVLHEELVCPQETTSEVLQGIANSARATDGHRANDPEKYLKDAKVLEKALQEDPKNVRYLYYLAQSYLMAKKYPEALRYYQQVVERKEPELAVAAAMYYVGILSELLKKPSNEVVKKYCDAYRYRQTRAEPLFRLSVHYFDQQQYVLGYAIAKYALEIPNPHERIYNEDWIYEYGLLFSFGNNASALGRYPEALAAYEKVLKVPQLPLAVREEVERNLEAVKSLLSVPDK